MSSASSASSSLSTPVTFNGQSTFSSSFQQVLQRAVSIASLPMQQLQDDVSTLQSQQSSLSTLGATFDSLQSALQAVSSAMTGDVTATSSDSSILTATTSSTTLPGTYSIVVADVGSSSNAISNAGSTPVTDPSTENISSSTSFTLTVNAVATTITPTGGTLDDLADAINNANAGVSATIVNLGSNASPDYRLALTSTELGPDSIQLNDGTNDLFSSVQEGTYAQYSVGGNSTLLSSTSDRVTLAPGLTANLIGANPDETVKITVAASESNLSNALSSFATAYNAAATAVTGQTGQSGGALAGQSSVYELQDALSQIANYTGTSGSVLDLSDLGFTLSSNGSLSFDSSTFNSLSASSIQQFLGGLSSSGFLERANDILSGVADPSTGILATEYNNLNSQIDNYNTSIANDQATVNLLQTNLQQQLSAADAAIAVLQEQSSYYTDLFQTENANKIAGLT
ncbi:MAG TPA: flagellar filament capping protein FliD [Bryobacteraceae bacterium]|jgi:flagellar hook-associated protein 2|nr:flagellar filament capping protein FliD [Bryobacteraceae bacterium]